MKIFQALLLTFITTAVVSCGGSEETTTKLSEMEDIETRDITNDKILSNVISDGAIPYSKDSCDKNDANDFNNFIGIPFGTSEVDLVKILGENTGGEYNDDSSSFVYYYKDAERVPITIWANSQTTQIEVIFMEVVSLVQFFDTDLEAAIEKYDIQECDAQWFGKTQKEVKKILGEPKKKESTEDTDGNEIVNFFYDSDDYSIALNFKFYQSQDYKCTSIMVNWFY